MQLSPSMCSTKWYYVFATVASMLLCCCRVTCNITTTSSPAPITTTITTEISTTPVTTERLEPDKFDAESLVKDCKVRDRVTLDSCLYQMLERLRPILPTGMEELHLPPLEPLRISNITFEQGAGIAEIKADFTDLQVRGLSNFTTVYSRSDPKRFRFQLGLIYPHLHLKGHYNITGNILLLPIIGEGPFWAELYDVRADIYNWLEVVDEQNAEKVTEKPWEIIEVSHNKFRLRRRFNPITIDSLNDYDVTKGSKQLRLRHTETNFQIGDCKVQLDNLFNGDEFLGETVNTFLNANANEILEEFKPQVTAKLDQLIRSVFGDAVTKLPLADWLSAAKFKDISSGEIIDVTVVSVEQ